ncbi:hypothetical protein [Streptomyces sp. NPDC058155]|uniref:hypothetical protein n=1 Tax=Streptomyces sp. NPDC058155 TaxID=3346359 RepID=UPI0036E6D759
MPGFAPATDADAAGAPSGPVDAVSDRDSADRLKFTPDPPVFVEPAAVPGFSPDPVSTFAGATSASESVLP